MQKVPKCFVDPLSRFAQLILLRHTLSLLLSQTIGSTCYKNESMTENINLVRENNL